MEALIQEIERDFPDWEWLVRRNIGGTPDALYFANAIRTPKAGNSLTFPNYGETAEEAVEGTLRNLRAFAGSTQ